jgi:hypothetical protein
MRAWLIAALLLAFAFAPFARADRAPPPPKEPTFPLVIEAGPKVAEAKLVIPKKMLGTLKGALDSEGTDRYGSTLSPVHTIVAGAALALALTFGGLWLARKGPGGSRSLGFLIGAVAFLGIGALAFADLRPAPRPVDSPRWDKVVIEVVDTGDEVKLVVNKAKLAKALEDKK